MNYDNDNQEVDLEQMALDMAIQALECIEDGFMTGSEYVDYLNMDDKQQEQFRLTVWHRANNRKAA
jgi:hypothetical protein